MVRTRRWFCADVLSVVKLARRVADDVRMVRWRELLNRWSTSALVICTILSGCDLARNISDSVDPRAIGRQRASGIIRLSDDVFGLLIYPCTDETLAVVELGIDTWGTGEFSPILRVTFDSPMRPRSVIVSTDPDLVTPGVRRTVLDGALLDRVNTDESYGTGFHPEAHSGLDVRAFSTEPGIDISGGADVGITSRFDLKVNQATVYSGVGASIGEFKCTFQRRLAWDPDAAIV